MNINGVHTLTGSFSTDSIRIIFLKISYTKILVRFLMRIIMVMTSSMYMKIQIIETVIRG